ncbi:MAG: hypothetical protein OXC95_00355 [Dehalococcoidia bacterium]|nr:hypothetical protein [Dehalococcoidia bacterium]
MLTQDEAERLIAMEKRLEDPLGFMDMPLPGSDMTIRLISDDGAETFYLDARHGRNRRGEWSPDRWKLQLRYGNTAVLVRLETGGPAHPNPQDAPNRRLARYARQRVETPHIQRYVEGSGKHGDGWAFPPPPEFTALDDIAVTWREFLQYCNITDVAW